MSALSYRSADLPPVANQDEDEPVKLAAYPTDLRAGVPTMLGDLAVRLELVRSSVLEPGLDDLEAVA